MKGSTRKLVVGIVLFVMLVGLVPQSIFAASQLDKNSETVNVSTDSVLSSKISDRVWENIGNEGFSKGAVNYTSIALDNNNIPYVAYVDLANNSKVTVKKFIDNTWKTVGSEGFSAKKAKDTSIVIDKNNIPYVVYIEEPSKEIIVNKLVGNKWNKVGNVIGTSDDVAMAVDSNGIPYVVFTYSLMQLSFSSTGFPDPYYFYGVKVSKYINGKWENRYKSEATSTFCSSPSIVIDNYNTPYVAYENNGIKVKELSDSVFGICGTSQLISKNQTISKNTEGAQSITIAVVNRSLYIAYKGKKGNAAVIEYNSGDYWKISKGKAEYTSIAVDNSDIPYVAFVDSENGSKAVVKKYEDDKWNTVGSEGFSKGKAQYTALALDNNGTPYVVYRDGANGNKATVKAYCTVLPNAELTLNIEGNGSVVDWTSGGTKSFVLGSAITLNAIADEDSIFSCWKDSSGRVVSKNSEYTFELGCNETLTAVFADNSKKTVTFKNANGEVIQTAYISDEVTFPEAPAMFGYTFTGWDKTIDEIKAATENIVVTALFEKLEETVTVSVYGGTGSGEYNIKDIVTAVADVPEPGQKFAYWKDGLGNTLSYHKEYEFYASRDVVITAVFVAESEVVIEEAAIAITSITKTDDKISFVAERVVPDGNTVLSHGIIATKNSSTGDSETNFVIGGVDVLKATSIKNELIGTFVLNKIAALNETWFARGYVLYKDSEGNVLTIYSSIVQETMN